jgi:hypothetical protein
VDVRFGEMTRLIGYTLEPSAPSGSSELDLTLYWRAILPEGATADQKAFIHLLNPEGEIVAQHDGEPVSGRRPTRTWREGEVIIDTHRLVWYVQDYTGPAAVAVGLYDAVTLERLPAFDPQGLRWRDDRAILGDVIVR